ncbi:class I SAM-dependent methyltransferase [Rhodococcus sp. ABRD24]|uniref:class I SAM-dependent methyltransferase n=1 Tax=Rhodococcus sp. ABRD24 TaxID=2507582 RepID=UPI00103DE8AC|nr:class I SAM-dependent methyltransferase [Rhodococcus sp. ABRD24]QBJ97091.1 class I SAM-dependent methyltransferase [Rhodococcus sp. ABRD24]
MVDRAVHEVNRRSWNAATVAHNSHKGDQAEYFRSGGSTLFPEEIELLGELSGRKVVHLQCNSGQDSLSLALLGADVVGVDISDEAIDFARELAAEVPVDALFERADIYDWFDSAACGSNRFDRVFSSYGAVIWLTDLTAWAQGIARALAPGGLFVLIDFHPFSLVFDENWRPAYPYGGATPIVESTGVGDYVADTIAPDSAPGAAVFANPYPSTEFNWSIAEIATALRSAGLTIESISEYPYANGWRGFDRMEELPGRRFAPPSEFASIPLMFSITARKS